MYKLKQYFCILIFFLLINLLLLNNVWKAMAEQQNKISNYFRGKNTIEFSIDKQLNREDFNTIFKQNKNSAIFYDVADTNEFKIIGILYKRTIELPMVSQGRFFIEEDFAVNSPMAVVGANIYNSQYVSNGFFEYENVNYKVIGVIKYKYSASLDNIVFINLNTLLGIDKNSIFYLDGKNKSIINDTFNRLSSIYPVKKYEHEKEPLERIICIKSQYEIICIILYLFIILILFFYIYFLIQFHRNEIKVKILLGISKIWILLHLYKKILFYIFFPLFISLIEVAFIIRNDIPFYMLQLLFELCICIVIVIASLYFTVSYWYNNPASTSKKG